MHSGIDMLKTLFQSRLADIVLTLILKMSGVCESAAWCCGPLGAVLFFLFVGVVVSLHSDIKRSAFVDSVIMKRLLLNQATILQNL